MAKYILGDDKLGTPFNEGGSAEEALRFARESGKVDGGSNFYFVTEGSIPVEALLVIIDGEIVPKGKLTEKALKDNFSYMLSQQWYRQMLESYNRR